VEKLGVRAFPVFGDLAVEADCDTVGKEVLARMGAVDIVVNNVGWVIHKDDPPWDRVPMESWIDSYQVNFMSTLRMSKLFLPGIRENGWGRFINISSQAANVVPANTDYSAAKAALNKLTADMAKDVGRYGATCNGIAPGATHSAAIEDWLGGIARERGWPGTYADWEKQWMIEISPQQAIQSFARADDIAALAAFLASPRAGHLTGVTIRLDSGHSSSVY
jgi:NAD(P)-dependent dehydrogenase (short-subunit alcohol dehydrogenase family)